VKLKPGDVADYHDLIGFTWRVTIKQVNGDELRAVTDDVRDVRDDRKYFRKVKKERGGKDGCDNRTDMET